MTDFTPPQDYSSAFANLPTPGQSFTQGVAQGVGIQQTALQQQVQQYQFARMRQMQQAAAQVAQNPTPENISQLSIAFPEMSEQFKRSYDMLQPQQQRNNVQHMSAVYAAMQSGRPDIASSLLNDYADSLKNSGQDDSAARTMAQWATTDPNTFKAHVGILLAGVMGPDKFGETFNNLATGNKTEATTAPEVAKTQADTDYLKAQSQNLAGRLQLDRDTLMTNTQTKLRELQLQYGMPPDDARKIINDSAMGAAAGEQSAARLNDLATRMEQASKATGFAGTAAEAYKSAFGVQDGVSALKQEYARIVNNQALAQIKDSLGGRVTDVDMKTAMSTVPSANASPELVASYLRGVAKLQILSAAQQEAQAEWLSQVGRAGHLGPAPHDITVMGTQVPAGTTFADFSRQLLQQKAKDIQAQSAVSAAQGKSYMRFAQPGQPEQVGTAAGGTY
jgi:hypothetical protein